MEWLLSLLLTATIVVWAVIFRLTVSDARLRLLLNCISALYLVPPLLLVNGFRLADAFEPLLLHRADLLILTLKASLLTSLANLLCFLGVTYGFRDSQEYQVVVSNRGMAVAKIFTVVSLGALYLYAAQIGGIQQLFTTVLLYKRGEEFVYTELSFLKSLAPIGAASYMLFVDRLRQRFSWSVLVWSIAAFVAGFSGTYIIGGRLALFLFIAPLYLVLPRVGRAVVLVGLPILAFLIFHPERLLFGLTGDEVGLDYRSAIVFIISDFFPPTANTYLLPLWDSDILRGFRDVITVPMAFVPKRIFGFGDYQGESLALEAIVNFPNAVDLIAFGLLSASVFGVMVWSFVYGTLLYFIARVIRNLTSLGYSVSALGLLLYFMFRPMYFSPHHFAMTFMSFIPLLLVARPVLARRRTANAHRGNSLASGVIGS